MTTDLTSPESTSQKRLRRTKQDPQFIFEHISKTVDSTPVVNKQKPKSVISTNDTVPGADLYEPGDVVWSKLGSFPWWPALIYRSNGEGGSHTRTLNSNNKPKRQFFVYFYGKYLEYAWLSTRSLLKYSGLNDFIENAEAAVQKAVTKSEKVELANRYQLKVSVKKRVQWDGAIELADRALTMTRNERIEEFKDLLNAAKTNKKSSKNSSRRRNVSIESIPDEPLLKKRQNGKNADSTATNSDISQRKSSTCVKQSEIEYEYPVLPTNQIVLPALRHFIQANIPPLSNYEQKQIVEGLLHHPNHENLTFDEAERFARDKAIEIVEENYHHRMDIISPEWFYDSILLKYPSLIFKYRSWFTNIEPHVIPDETDALKLKQWQIALMIQAQIKHEQQQSRITDST
ncbi:unnamed protein product [Adineta ricciae]|uniref:PWWP domain-containing protein n=1 Tax=Adineta ricciae TaxID=249248 RepID=A0A813XM29_ADIRI|nr:unnamed protein product [Adineta ricciae]CAF0964690.1 unnamed protein product [Adineta ricciae]